MNHSRPGAEVRQALFTVKVASATHDASMTNMPTTVLLVEDNVAEARRIQDSLAGSTDSPFQLVWVRRLAEALALLAGKAFQLVLLDLMLPDASGMAAVTPLLKAAPDALILVLCAEGGDEVARQAVCAGARDYLIKGHVDAHWLPRALIYLMDRQGAENALRASEARFRAMSDASPLGIFVSDATGGCVYTNAAYQRISGLSLEQSLGTNWSTAIHPEDRPRVLSEWQQAVAQRQVFHAEFRFLRQDGSVVWTRVNSGVLEDDQDGVGRIKTVEDISERKATERVLREAEEALFAEKERAQVTLNSIGDAVLTTDLLGQVTYLNQVAEDMTGWSCTDALGLPLATVFNIIDGETRQTAANPARNAMQQNQTVALEADCLLIRKNGDESAIEDSAAPIHSRDGQVTGAVIVFHDVTASRSMALKMSHLAQHDFLTDLPNRVLLSERFSQAIRLAHRHRKQVAVLFLDLDYFKHINDSLGHALGDQLLQSVAKRLVQTVRATDTVCRQGGDEFVILLAELEQPQDAAAVADKLLAAFALPLATGAHDLHVSLSIGISIYPDDGINADTVMQNADTAMYHAKESGRNNYQFFRADMNARAVRRLFVESNLRRALKNGEFVLHFQPKMDIASGALTGAEALVRWQDPEFGLTYPDRFVSIAEECGLIVPIGRWVLREACRQIQAWRQAGLAAVPVAVNISAMEFRHKGFVESVASILQETGLAPRYLELELTESTLMHEGLASSSVLGELKAMGVSLAVDDFGTGYSSLSYLRRFPIDTLKVDQSFVRDVISDTDSATIVSAIIGMGRNLHLRVVAEGVETQEQLEFLRTQHCDEGQGYLFSRALAATEFVKLLRTPTPQ